MRRTVGSFAMWAALLVLSVPAAAQDNLAVGGIIQSEGVATVEAAPDFAGFWIHKTSTGATLTEAIAGVKGFAQALDEQLDAAGLAEPATKAVSDVSIANVNEPTAKVSARLLFPARRFASPEDGLDQFAQLVAGLQAAAKALGGDLEGPYFTVQAEEEIVQTAVARAVEQALPAAVGAARVMRTRIDSVDTVEVTAVNWNQEPDTRAPQPQVRRVTCTARVKVRYIFAPGT